MSKVQLAGVLFYAVALDREVFNGLQGSVGIVSKTRYLIVEMRDRCLEYGSVYGYFDYKRVGCSSAWRYGGERSHWSLSKVLHD